jgi:hypothetical protein
VEEGYLELRDRLVKSDFEFLNLKKKDFSICNSVTVSAFGHVSIPIGKSTLMSVCKTDIEFLQLGAELITLFRFQTIKSAPSFPYCVNGWQSLMPNGALNVKVCCLI